MHRLRSGGVYVLDCQAKLLDTLNTRLVVPLLPREDAQKPAARLNPLFKVGGQPLVMVTQFAASVPVTDLGDVVQSLEAHQDAALDMPDHRFLRGRGGIVGHGLNLPLLNIPGAKPIRPSSHVHHKSA